MQAQLSPRPVSPAPSSVGNSKTRALPAPHPPPPPPSLPPRKSGIAHGVRLFSATLTRRVAPGDRRCWQPAPAGLLGLGLAGCEDAQRALALAGPHCLALTSGDLCPLAVEGW